MDNKIEEKKIVATNGCFDILHIGHLRYLQAAKELGDILIVGINGDHSVQHLKGPNRPINNQEDRAELVAALTCVDHVFIFEETTADQFLQSVKPQIYVKGGDYNLKNLPEKKTLQSLETQVVFLPFQQGYSTTDILQNTVNR